MTCKVFSATIDPLPEIEEHKELLCSRQLNPSII